MPDDKPQIPVQPTKPTGATPYRPSSAKFAGPKADVINLAPPREPEPEIERGIDLTGQAKIIFAAGRGKTGKTTLLRWLTETSILNGGAPILADVDPSNATFSAYFANVARPETDNPAGVTAWLQELIEYCINERQSALIDLGGGDTTLRSLAAEMPGLAAHIEAAGMAPVMFHLTGPQPEDLLPALTLAARGFTPAAQTLVFNEYSIEPGSTRERAFARLTASDAYASLAQTCVKLWMPRLHAAEAVEARQCSFAAARDGTNIPQLGLFNAARVRVWLDSMDRRFAGVRSWIP